MRRKHWQKRRDSHWPKFQTGSRTDVSGIGLQIVEGKSLKEGGGGSSSAKKIVRKKCGKKFKPRLENRDGCKQKLWISHVQDHISMLLRHCRHRRSSSGRAAAHVAAAVVAFKCSRAAESAAGYRAFIVITIISSSRLLSIFFIKIKCISDFLIFLFCLECSITFFSFFAFFTQVPLNWQQVIKTS